MNNCNFTADILVTVTILVQTIAKLCFFNLLYLSKNTPFLQLKASVFALATPLYI
jgi:hypothetical protein